MDVIKMEKGMGYNKNVLVKGSFKINRSQCDEYYEHMVQLDNCYNFCLKEKSTGGKALMEIISF